jgi:peptidoglycan-associated lipoprotein
MKTANLWSLGAAALLAACSSGGTDNASATGAGGGAGGAGGAGGYGTAQAAPGSQEDLVVNVGDRVFFDTNKALLRQDAGATLDRQAAWLAKYPRNSVLLAGNCDERGTQEYNLALGNRRAYTVSTYLQSRGVAKARIETVSYGSGRPVALGSNEQAWAQNRNVITSLR